LSSGWRERSCGIKKTDHGIIRFLRKMRFGGRELKNSTVYCKSTTDFDSSQINFSVPSFRVKKKCVKVFSRMLIVATSSQSYRGTAEVNAIQNTILIDKRGTSEASQANLRKKRTGLPTPSSMRNLRKCMDVFQMSLVGTKSLNPITQKSSFMKAAFLTFTIPDAHTMLDSKKGYEALLKHMIEYLIYHFGVSRYVWRFERQERGQAHWHLCVNKYCELHSVKTYWLRLLAKEGLTRDYYSKYNYDPSSAVVIEGISTDNELAFYFSKYFNKKTQSDKPTAGRWWGSDLVTKQMPLPLVPITDRFTWQLDVLCRVGNVEVYDVEVKSMSESELKKPEALRLEKVVKPCSIIRSRKLPVVWLLCPEQRGIYDQYIYFNRANNVDAAMRLRREVLEYDSEVQGLIDSRYNTATDMAYLACVKEIKVVSSALLTNRQRSRRKSAAQAAEAKKMLAGVSLYT